MPVSILDFYYCLYSYWILSLFSAHFEKLILSILVPKCSMSRLSIGLRWNSRFSKELLNQTRFFSVIFNNVTLENMWKINCICNASMSWMTLKCFNRRDKCNCNWLRAEKWTQMSIQRHQKWRYGLPPLKLIAVILLFIYYFVFYLFIYLE